MFLGLVILVAILVIGLLVSLFTIMQDIKIIEEYEEQLHNIDSRIPSDYVEEEQNHFLGDR